MEREPRPSMRAGWRFDLTPLRGPELVVVAEDEARAREALVAYLVAADVVPNVEDAEQLLGEADAVPSGVLLP